MVITLAKLRNLGELYSCWNVSWPNLTIKILLVVSFIPRPRNICAVKKVNKKLRRLNAGGRCFGGNNANKLHHRINQYLQKSMALEGVRRAQAMEQPLRNMNLNSCFLPSSESPVLFSSILTLLTSHIHSETQREGERERERIWE